MTDISAVLTAHGETVLAGPTMRSAEAAIARAEQAGLTVERLVGMDNATPECRAFFANPEHDAWTKLDFAFRDQGKARNALAAAATGRWIAFLDADDLWSENWLVEAAKAMRAAEAAGERAVIHPEINWVFDKNANVIVNMDSDDPLFEPRFFYFRNFYDALALAPREAHLAIPYADRDLPKGYAFEDMQWAVETVAAGYVHRIARDTIIFKRRRTESQTTRASHRGVVIRPLDAMRVDRVDALSRGEET